VGNGNHLSPSTKTTRTMLTTMTTTTPSKPPTSLATCRPPLRRHRTTLNRFCRQKTSLTLKERFPRRVSLKMILITRVFQVPEILQRLPARPTFGRPDSTITHKMSWHPYFPLKHRQRRKNCRHIHTKNELVFVALLKSTCIRGSSWKAKVKGEWFHNILNS